MLATIFGSKLRAKVLGWMMTHADERFFVRQLTEILDEDSTNISRELARLAQAGILAVRQEGRQKYYQADSTSPIFEELRGLALKTIGIGDVLRNALQPIAARIRLALIFGSCAGGRANARSDVDVLIIGDAPFAEVGKALSSAQIQLKREINPVVYPVAEFKSKLSQENSFLNSIQSGEKIFLIGNQDELDRLENKRLAR